MKINKIKNQIGATAIEYALLAGLIAIVAVTGVSATGASVSNTFCDVAGKIGKTGCPSALSAKDKMAQNSVLNNSELSSFIFEELGLPAFSNKYSFSQTTTPDFSTLSMSGLKSSDGSKISNANDLFNALGISDSYKNYQEAMADYDTAYADRQKAYSSSYASADDALSAKSASDTAYWKAVNNVNDAGTDLFNAMKSSTAKIETSGSQLSFNSATASKNLNFVNFGNNSSNVSGKTSVPNVYTGQGMIDVTTPASNYE